VKVDVVEDTGNADIATTRADGGTRLAEAMAEAARALNTPETLEEVLDRLARAACTAIPGVDYAGVSIARRTGIETMAATDPIVERADQLQYELGEGPCLDAMAGHSVEVVPDMRVERRWPRFAPRAVELGVLSQLGIEIFRQGSTVGGLNLYASTAGALDDTTEHAAGIFAAHAAIALDKTLTVTSLTEALRSRQLIGEAVGILMERYAIDDDKAFRYLVRVSQNTNARLRDIAQTLVDEVAQRARDHDR
jgi:GAF domain-containing protein